MMTSTDEDLSKTNIAEDNAAEIERAEVMIGRQHLALYGFIGVFLAVLLSAMLYLAGRRSPAQAADPAPVAAAARAAEPVAAVAAAASPTAQEPKKPAPQAPKPAAAAPAALDQVLPNRTYLQVGSLDTKVAELLTQGLRTKGVAATVAPGISAAVARIIVGPFQTAAEMGVAHKQLVELGFTPFPRQFQPAELPAAAPASAKP